MNRKQIEPNTSRIGERWTKEEVEKLRFLISKGKNPLLIAKELRRCDKGVSSKAYALGLNFSKKQ